MKLKASRFRGWILLFRLIRCCATGAIARTLTLNPQLPIALRVKVRSLTITEGSLIFKSKIALYNLAYLLFQIGLCRSFAMPSAFIAVSIAVFTRPRVRVAPVAY